MRCSFPSQVTGSCSTRHVLCSPHKFERSSLAAVTHPLTCEQTDRGKAGTVRVHHTNFVRLKLTMKMAFSIGRFNCEIEEKAGRDGPLRAPLKFERSKAARKTQVFRILAPALSVNISSCPRTRSLGLETRHFPGKMLT